VELRLRNIFSGPKKRPPVLFLALMFAVCLLCGNLVSCQMAEAEVPKGPSQSGDVSTPEELPVVRAVPVDPDHPPRTEEEEWLLQALFLSADTQAPFQVPQARLLGCLEGEDAVLGAALVTDHLENTLVLGVVDRETHELDPSAFRRSCHAGVANVITFRDYDGTDCLLYTFNGQENGQYTGQAGLVCLEEGKLCWKWPVEGDARFVKAPPDGPAGVYSEYEAYWQGHLALLAPGGVDIYEVNPEFEWGKDEPASKWQIGGDELFYADPSSASALPMPVYFQALRWLTEYTRDPGGWRVVSLLLNEEKCDPGTPLDCYTLQACTDDGTEELTADLYFPYEPSLQPRSYDPLDHAEVREQE